MRRAMRMRMDLHIRMKSDRFSIEKITRKHESVGFRRIPTDSGGFGWEVHGFRWISADSANFGGLLVRPEVNPPDSVGFSTDSDGFRRIPQRGA